GAQGEVHVNVVQVVLRRSNDFQVLPVSSPALLGDGNFSAPGQVVAGDGAGGVHHLLGGARRHDLAPVDARTRAHVDDIVGRPHGVLVVLHHQQGVAQVPQVLYGLQEHVVVPLVQ